MTEINDQDPPLNKDEAIKEWARIKRMTVAEVMHGYKFKPYNEGGTYLMAIPNKRGEQPGQWSQLCKRWSWNGYAL